MLKEEEITFNMLRIQELSHLHYNLVNLTLKINELFGITTIVAMVVWFGYAIDTMYLSVYFTFHKMTDDTFILYTFYIVYLLFHFSWLFIMVAMFSRTREKANETATYIHKIWNKYASNEEVDRRVRHLQLISVRLLNTKLNFTAKDFFNLDWTFFHTMIAAITTYLVILIQFNI
ncbi:7tm 7 domain containing protein [Asbolus verrucosus]|uniref:7tm 7 domain containing protein n=1 Tax=Asbolus verrucosus TaxID=1661398 RepID=A0A482V9A6_ASBVE|nr:7tm 7 domain containing protein [Asbolus verrucosus]